MKLEKDLTEYQSIPFWSWNDKLEPDELRRQIRWMKNNGIGGFFMHARGGLKTEYMSEEWMQCVDACVDEAKKNGMDAWVYDENGWPSGFAGGKLLEAEENRDCYLSYKIGAFDGEASVSYKLAEESLLRVSCTDGDGEYLNVYIHVSVSTADILNPEVVRQFIELTHEQYKERYGEDFANCIKGFFTDEPQYFRWDTPYTRMLEEYFKEHYDEDVLDGLGLLFVEKEGYRSFRYKYWSAMHHLMLENFGKQIYTWCNEHGVSMTGHYVAEESLNGQMTCCAGIMPFYKYMHKPGIDWIARRIGNTIDAHQLNSVCRQYGKKHALTEAFGCCGWDVTPMEWKSYAEFQSVSGVNQICHHLLPYAEHGQRKRDYPAHFSEINPWVKDYFKVFNDYFTNLGYLLSNSNEAVNVAVLHPIRSAYLYYKRTQWPGEVTPWDAKFSEQVEMLSNHHLQYHFLDETLLAEDGFVRDGKIGCGLMSYEYLILPTIYTMDKTTETLLRDYIAQGGKVLLLDEKPAYLEGDAFEYDYLESNITLDEILSKQPYEADEVGLQVQSSYRTYEGKDFIVVQNYSDEICEVNFDVRGKAKSFKKLNLQTSDYECVPLTVTLRPYETQVLFLHDEVVENIPEREIVHLSDTYTLAESADNYLTLDKARYSKDNVNYSEELFCMGIFQQMLQERYQGPLYLKYCFEVKTVPKKLSVLAEVGSLVSAKVNNQEIHFKEPSDLERNIYQVDIVDFVKEGQNEILLCLNYYQSEQVYYALFGENVTETLRNCLVYDTDIESIYLAGDFGVYEREGFRTGEKPNVYIGDKFYLAELKSEITNVVKDGFPFFAGKLRLKQKIQVSSEHVCLEFKGRFQAIRVYVNGCDAGLMLLDNRLDISPFVHQGENEIEIELHVSNRNLLGPHHHKSDEEPTVVAVETYECPGSWIDGKSSQYRESYSFVNVDLY